MKKTSFQPFLLSRRHLLGLLFLSVLSVVSISKSAQAALTTLDTFTQAVTNGAHAIDTVDTGTSFPYTHVAGAVTMQSMTFSFVAQTSAAATFGTASNAVYWENAGSGTPTYTIAMAATSGATAVFLGGAGVDRLDFNDATANSNDNDRTNDDGADIDTAPGQMRINASTGTITRVKGTDDVNINKGSSTLFNEGVTDSITIIDASSAAQTFWAGYITGMTVSERMAEEQLPGTYTLSMTLTMT